jgi:poly(A) polymerase
MMTENFTKGPRISGAWLRSVAIGKVFDAFDAAKAEARVVGGAVRNELLGVPVKEIDIATPAVPEEVMRLAKRAGLGVHPTGIDHGTVTIVADGVPFEVTTLRRDVETDGRHAVVAYTTAWEEDAQRRDFTINALYCSRDGHLYDAVGGLNDLRRRRVRFIGDASERIREDYLRILRFFRFSAAYGKGQLDATGLAAAVALKDNLAILSPERIGAEVLKLLAAPHAAEVVRVMHETGVLQLVFPAGSDPERLARLQAIEAALGEPPDALCRLAALAVNETADVPELAKRLRLSNSDAGVLVKSATVNPALQPTASDTAARALLYRLGANTFRRAVRLAWARSGASAAEAAWRSRALLADRWKAPRMPFGGTDLLALGMPAGPAVGAALKAFEDWWIDSDFTSDAAAQRKKLKELAASAHS